MFPYILLKKTYKISKNYNEKKKNLQVTYKILEKNYLNSTEIIIAHTNLQEKLNIIQIQCLNSGTNHMKKHKHTYKILSK